MLRSKLETLKVIFTSGYWLIASLTGAFFSFFALNRGGVVVFIEVGACFVLLNLLAGEYKLKQIPSSYWAVLGICFYLVVASFLFATHEIRTKYIMYLFRMLFIVFTIHCLSLKKIDSRVYELLPILWCLSIGWQFVAVKFYNMPFGTYTNPHYLSNFVISTLPLIVFSFWTTDRWYKWIFILFALLDIELLLKTGSRPAILGLSFSSLFSLIFFIKSRTRWIGFLVIVLSFGFLYITNYGGVVNHLEELIVNLRTEARVYLWKSALQMLENNNIIDWIVGNGIGSYRTVYPEYSVPEFRPFWFAHLHALEILYENGFTGVLLVLGGMIGLFGLTIKTLINTISENISILIKCMLVIFLCWMIHSNLTFPFYSKYAQYPFGFILGTMLVLIDQSNLATKNRTTPAKE